jgi:SCP-2 sterol transfer family protein
MGPASQRHRPRGERALAAWVRGAGDAQLERLVGSRAVLTAAFALLARRFDPLAADGFAGDVVFELRRADGRVRAWTLTVAGDSARPRRGPAPRPALRVVIGVADFARLAAGVLDPGTALLTGRLDVHGPFAVAARLGEMFGLARVA